MSAIYLKYYLSISFLILLNNLKGQDPHFSQYFSSPLTINPANTGNYEGSMRLGANFRNQWQGIGSPYITATTSFEKEVLHDKLFTGNRLAFGILGLYDKSIDGGLLSNYFSGSVGYHIFLTEDEVDRISFGFQTTFVNKRLDNSILSFANQFSNDGFNLLLSSNENFNNLSIKYFDYNTGLQFSHYGENMLFYSGFSVYHLKRPTESFMNDVNNKVERRYNISSGLSFLLSETDNIYFNASFISQSVSKNYMVGAFYEKKIQDDADGNSVSVGMMHRFKDSFIPYIGIRYNKVLLGISYDAKSSKMDLINKKSNSFELSLSYIVPDNSEFKKMIPWY